MDPSRPPLNPSERTNFIRSGIVHTSDRDASPAPTPGPSQPHTSLPSIRQLHPDLPPTHAQASMATAGHAFSHTHTHVTRYPVASGSSLGPRSAPDESDDEGDTQEPPKKKRRRQALSCTECKRRKIKCDRAQPCGPCVRRGEHLKCQWHIIEPMEKYVTRTEYDELKAKVIELENIVHRLSAGGSHTRSVPSTSSPLPSGPYSDAVPGTAITPYHTLSAPGPTTYYTLPQAAPSTSVRRDSSASLNRLPHLIGPRSPTSSRPSTSHGPANRSAPASRSPIDPPSHPHASPPSTSNISPPSEPGSLRTPGSRRASLSLAAITTPYHPDHRPASSPKKYHAQTPPPPGQRLRPEQVSLGPAYMYHPHHPPHPPHRLSPGAERQQALQIQG